VAEALAAEARARGRSATVVGGVAGRADGAALRAELERAEAAHDAVYLDGPALDDPGVAAVLDRHRSVAVVAAEGVTTRGALAAAADTLGRLGVPVLGVVVAPRARR
jgi:Mrp family chromosome partitioning ATPase